MGKTRWLAHTLDALARQGVVPYGVIAPGDWAERRSASGAVEYEKRGIFNVLLPQREQIRFAVRPDLAAGAAATASPGEDARGGSAAGGSTFPEVPGNMAARTCPGAPAGEGAPRVRGAAIGEPFSHGQSSRAGLGWTVDDAAIARVNAHFQLLDALLHGEGDDALLHGEGKGLLRNSGKGPLPNAGGAEALRQRAEADAGLPANVEQDSPGLLVVDELGKLELECGTGLDAAVTLVSRGAAPRVPHAVVVVRPSLLKVARQRFADALWGGMALLAPDGDSRSLLAAAFR